MLSADQRRVFEAKDGSVLHIFAKNEDVHKHNSEYLRSFPRRCVVKQTAEGKHVTGRDSSPKIGLAKSIPLQLALAVGAVVKLNVNLYVPFGAKVGLFNGALGKVHAIVYTDKRGPFSGHLPRCIVVEFFSYRGPSLFGGTPTDTSAPRTITQRLVPIYPQTLPCDCNRCFRTGFPLSVRAAGTIHTMQGMTVKATGPGPTRVVAHLNDTALENLFPNATYTALSRNTDIKNLALHEALSGHVFRMIGNTAINTRQRAEITRLERAAALTIQKEVCQWDRTTFINKLRAFVELCKTKARGSVDGLDDKVAEILRVLATEAPAAPRAAAPHDAADRGAGQHPSEGDDAAPLGGPDSLDAAAPLGGPDGRAAPCVARATARRMPPEPSQVVLWPPITDVEERRYASVMQEGAPGDELFERFNAKVYRSQILCMLPGTWLNDEIINQFLFLLQERSARLCEDFAPGQRGQGARLRCYMHNTQFYTKLTEGGVYDYSRVEKWTTRGTRKADLFDKDIVFFPRNISGAHWTLCVAYIVERRIEYLDSMGAAGAECMADVLRYLADEHADKKNSPLDTSTWTTKSHLRSCPQQLNANDCGVFLCTFVNHLSVGAQLIFSQSDMEFYRKRITISLLNGMADMPF
jgi:hypothetical protein